MKVYDLTIISIITSESYEFFTYTMNCTGRVGAKRREARRETVNIYYLPDQYTLTLVDEPRLLAMPISVK